LTFEVYLGDAFPISSKEVKISKIIFKMEHNLLFPNLVVLLSIIIVENE